MIEASEPDISITITAPDLQQTANVRFEAEAYDPNDAAEFRSALGRQAIAQDQLSVGVPSDSKSLGKVVGERMSGLASEFSKDQQYVSKLLEQAARTGDSMHLMRAMLSLHDYQVRVQAMSKTVSKAAGAIDQLTKMQ